MNSVFGFFFKKYCQRMGLMGGENTVSITPPYPTAGLDLENLNKNIT